jgi:hypothetical protein
MREKQRGIELTRCQLCLSKTYVWFNNFSPSWHREVGYSDARLGGGRYPPATVRHSQAAKQDDFKVMKIDYARNTDSKPQFDEVVAAFLKRYGNPV